jgi:hypothetical protein
VSETATVYNAGRSWKKASVPPPKSAIAEFIDENIKLNEKGELWSLAKHQRAALNMMYAQPYSMRLWSEIKKSGKTMLGACVVIYEAFTHADCECLSVANDEEQAMSRVFATAVALCQTNPELAESVVKITQNEIRFSNGSVIRAIASGYKGAAGGCQRVTVFDELWAFDQERMTRLYEELRPPPTEGGSYVFIVSYAGFSGESTVLEALYKRGLSGKRISKRYEVYADAGLIMFWSHTGRQPWHSKAYFEEERRTLRPNQFARLHRNEWVSSESVFITPEQWDRCVDSLRTPMLVRAALYLGVDVGVKSDNAGVVGVTWDKKSQKLVLAWRTPQSWRLMWVCEEPHDSMAASKFQNVILDILQIDRLGFRWTPHFVRCSHAGIADIQLRLRKSSVRA